MVFMPPLPILFFYNYNLIFLNLFFKLTFDYGIDGAAYEIILPVEKVTHFYKNKLGCRTFPIA